MKEERYYLSFDDCEQGILIRALNDKKPNLNAWVNQRMLLMN